jgi:hypothetical protein
MDAALVGLTVFRSPSRRQSAKYASSIFQGGTWHGGGDSSKEEWEDEEKC